MEMNRRKTDNDPMLRDIAALMDLMPAGVRWVNRAGECEYINQAFSDMFGYQLSEIRLMDDWFIRAYPDPDSRKEIRDWYAEKIPALVRGTTPPPLQAAVTCRDGSIKQVIVSAHIAMGRIIAIYADITDHAKAMERQLEVERMFRLTFEGARDAICWVNVESGILVNCNQAAEVLFGAPRSEIIGRHFTYLHPPDTKEQVLSLFEAATTVPEPCDDIEAEIVSKSGRRIPVLIRSSMTHIADKCVVQAVFLDISERKRAETALQKSCTLLQKTLSSLNESVFIVETGTRIIIDCNSTVEPMFGYTREEIVGRHTSCLHVSEEMSRMFGTEMQKEYAKQGYFETEFFMRRKDGTHFPSEHFVNPIKDGHGVIVSHVCVVRDISERKRAESSLHEREALYRAMVEAFDGLMYICSRERRIEFMNRQMIERIGYDATGERCHEALHRFESPCPWCVNERVFNGESVQWEFQSPKGGRWYHIVNNPIRNAMGITAKQVTITDITARKQAERYRVELEAERIALEEQRQFLGLVSHELRTPLSIIDGAAQLILLTSPQQSTCLTQAERIRSATLRLSDLIDGCLTDDRLSTSGWRPDLRELDIVPLVQSVIEQSTAKAQGHTFETALDSPLRYNCDPTLVTIMLSNLLDNAMKYSPDGGKIMLVASCRENGSILIEISDQGIGIPPDQMEKIFNRFHRTWQIPGVPGAGLGLSLVKRIAEIHGGSVACRSIPGSGSTFTVTLPPPA